MCISMEFNFNAFSEKKNLSHHGFLGRKCKINFFEENCVYCAAFIKLKCRRFHTGLVDGQNTKHLKFGFCQLLYALLKIAISENFLRFLKIVPSMCKNPFMNFILPEKGRLNTITLNQPIL